MLPRPRTQAFSRTVRRLPFTTALIVTVLTASSVVGVLSHPLDATQLSRWGFGWEDLLAGHVWRLLSAPFLVLRPYMALTITAILLFFVGTCELVLRTRRTAVTFAVAHVAGYLGALFILQPLGRAGWETAAVLASHRDVGASNGAFGAVGALLMFLPVTLRSTGLLILGAYLTGALLVEGQLWDVQHLVAFTTGIALGAIFLHRDAVARGGPRVSTEVLHRERPRLMAWLVGGMGVVNVLAAALLPHHEAFQRLEKALPLGLPHAPRMMLLFGGLLLFPVAGSLGRAQRVGWWMAFLLLLSTTVLQLELGINKMEALFAFVFLLLLAAWKEDFPAPRDPLSMRAAAVRLVAMLVGVPIVSWIAALSLRGLYEGFPGPAAAFVDVLRRLLYLAPEALLPMDKRGDWLLEAIPLAFWSGVVTFLAQSLRAARAPRAKASEREQVRRLVREHGRTGTDFMTTWTGNAYYFGPGDLCCVAYRVHAGIAVALGDPIGNAALRGPTLSGFVAFCKERGWSPAVLAATDAIATSYADCGLKLLKIGEEAVIDLGALEFKGKEWQNMRTALNRAGKLGISFRLFEGGRVPAELESQMREIERSWQNEQELPPMEFTLGSVEDIHDPDVEVAVAVDASGRVHGYVDWLPVPETRGWVIDLMRRRPDCMSGTMEFLIGMSLLAFQEQGDRFASLATAPLADLDRDDDQTLVPRLLGLIFERFESFYDFRSLFDFKDRFQPRWNPVYLAYGDPAELPTIALAILRAHLPQLGWAQAARLLGTTLADKLRARSDALEPKSDQAGPSSS